MISSSSPEPGKNPADLPQDGASEPARRPRSGLVVLVAAAVLLAGIGGLAALALRGSVEVPSVLVNRIEAVLVRGLDGQADADLGGIELSMTEAGRPRMVLRDLSLRDYDSPDSVTLPAFEVTLARRALMRGELRPETLTLDGARLRLSRDDTGILSLALQSGGTLTQVPSLPAMIAQIDALFDRPGWQALRRVTLSDLTLDLADARMRDVVTLSGGEAVLEVGASDLSLALSVRVPGADGAGADLRFSTRKGLPETALDLRLDAVPADLLAGQGGAFANFSVFDGDLSGHMTGRLTADGAVAALDGALTLGAGGVTPGGQLAPIELEEGHVQWSFVAGRPRIRVDALSIRSDRVRFQATGYAEAVSPQPQALSPDPSALPDLLFQGDLRDIWVDARPRAVAPVEVAGVMVAGRWSSAERRFDLGQIVIEDGKTDALLHGSGVLQLPPEAPATVRLDARSAELAALRVLDFWPASGRGMKAGNWLRRNLADGVLENVAARMTWQAGSRPVFATSFDFREADVRILPSFPPIRGGRGHGTLHEHRFTLVASDGQFQLPDQGAINIAGTSFQVPDTRIRGSDAYVGISAGGPVPAGLTLLDRPPIRLLDRVRLPVARLDGMAAAAGAVTVPLRNGAKVDLSTLDVAVDMTDLRFEDLAPGKDFRSPDLRLRIADETIALTGSGTLAAVPLDLELRRGLRAPATEGTRITGEAQLSPEGLAGLGVVLPPGTISGATSASYTLRLARGRAPELEVTSSLAGAALRVPQLNWSKSAAREGRLTADIRLGPQPEVTSISLDAPGMLAEGAITLRPATVAGTPGGLDRITLDRLRIGDWLDAEAVLTGQGPGVPPAIAVSGGRLDLRSLPKGGSGAGGPRSAASAPLEIDLDRVVVTDNIVLTNLAGRVRSGASLDGALAGRVNGGSPVTLVLSRSPSDTQRVRVTGADAGTILADAGILRTLRGGALDLTLTARAQRPILDGALEISGARLIETPAAMQFLSAISVVGLFDQMANGGIAFSEISSGLSISPEGITLREGRANGAALGVTFEGVVMPAQNKLDLQGVVSPIYMLNGLGGALLARRGEGLVGVTYRLLGPPNNPNVELNPLTLLTPGVFRDLFRRTPPDLTQ